MTTTLSSEAKKLPSSTSGCAITAPSSTNNLSSHLIKLDSCWGRNSSSHPLPQCHLEQYRTTTNISQLPRQHLHCPPDCLSHPTRRERPITLQSLSPSVTPTCLLTPTALTLPHYTTVATSDCKQLTTSMPTTITATHKLDFPSIVKGFPLGTQHQR